MWFHTIEALRFRMLTGFIGVSLFGALTLLPAQAQGAFGADHPLQTVPDAASGPRSSGTGSLATQVFYVSAATGVDVPSGGTLGNPWRTLAYALSQVSGTSSDPVELRVAEGTYAGGTVMESYVSLLGGYKTGFGFRDPLVYISVIDGGGTASHAVTCASNATLDGFTVTGGNAGGAGDDANGAGFFCDSVGGMTISGNLIAGNTAGGFGGGVYARDSTVTVSGNRIVGNQANAAAQPAGGGVYATGATTTLVLEGNILAGNGSSASTSGRIVTTWAVGSVTARKNRLLGTDCAGYGNAVFAKGATETWTNNEFIGIDCLQLVSAASTGPAGVTLANNSLLGPGSGVGVMNTNVASVTLVNNVLDGFAIAAQEYGTTFRIVPVNNLFFSNTTDFRHQNFTDYGGANNVNLNVPGAAANVDGSPWFVSGPSYPWTANGVYSPSTFTTRLTDVLGIPGATGNGLAGRYVNPDIAQPLEFYIVASDSTHLTVLGDASAIALNTKTYRVDSLHLANGSNALDRGSASTPGVPADDIDGEERPGLDGTVDIGSDEGPGAYVPPVDATEPVSYVTGLGVSQSIATFSVPYLASDNGSGLQFVRLFYRRGRSGVYTQYAGTFTASPISYTAPSGDGVYQFYTAATDNSGNTEAAPASPDAETLLTTSFTGSVVHVNGAATGAENGTTWTDAVRTIGAGSGIAGAFSVPQVWVAQGTYAETVALAAGSSTYGGFVGTETSLSQRDPAAHVTRIDGTGRYHAVTCASNATLDGFTVTGGDASGLGDEGNGAGFFCDSASGMTISGNLIAGNTARGLGGGIYARGSTVTVSGNRLVGNQANAGAQAAGGGVYATGATTTLLLEGNILAGNGSSASTSGRIVTTWAVGSVTARKNRLLGTDCAGYGNAVFAKGATETWTNNEFIGIDCPHLTYSSSTGSGGVTLANNTLLGPGTGVGVMNTNVASVTLVNNVLDGFAIAAQEYGAAYPIVPLNNLFFGNTTDFRYQNTTNLVGAAAINATVPGASGNVSGSPAFVSGPSYPWTANGVYSPSTFTTLLTDVLGIPGGTGNGLTGRYVNPDSTQPLEFYVVASDSTHLTVLGDASAIALNTKTYRVDSLHITDASAGEDLGTGVATGVPRDDIDGDLRPGVDGLFDIGSDEIGAWLDLIFRDGFQSGTAAPLAAGRPIR